MDDKATRCISSVLAMYDIMERRVTLVEKLKLNRQPFPEMDVVYLVSPTMEAVDSISADFKSKQKARYGDVHLFFLDTVPADVFAAIQSNSVLVNRVKTFKEIFQDFISTEGNVFHFDLKDSVEKLYGNPPDLGYPAMLGQRLAHMCITVNEHPSIRFQGSSSFAREIATALHQSLQQHKRSTPTFWCHGDDNHQDRDRGQLLILDRSFDPLSPLMHEYTYQAMANDLLDVEDGTIITYTATNNKGVAEEKQALLNENDELWMEMRHLHIAKVIGTIKDRMTDMMQNNAGAQLAKNNGADLSITTMAAAVKKLPEYQQTMGKLAEHVNVATQCMTAFGQQGLMELSVIEQTISTGFDEEGKEVKPQKLFQLVSETLKGPIGKEQKVRLLAIYYVSQRNVSGGEELVKQAMLQGRLNQMEKQAITNFDRLLTNTKAPAATTAASTAGKVGGLFASIFRGSATKHEATVEGEYADTRHVSQMRGLVEQFLGNQLPPDRFPAMGPSSGAAGKAEAKSVRKFGANSRWAKKDAIQFTGGRYMVFVAGGIAYPELRVGHEMSVQHSKEVIMGSTHIITPDSFMVDVADLSNSRSVNIQGKREDLL